MPPVSALSCCSHQSEGWAFAAVVVLVTFASPPADAQGEHGLSLSGYVAPRCWATAATAEHVTRHGDQWQVDGVPAARCSQGSMPLTVRLADAQPLAPSTTASASGSGTPAQSARGDLEIIVSPTI